MGFVSKFTQSQYRPKITKPGRDFSLPDQFVGLEFEVEHPEYIPKFQHYETHRDGSLRNRGIEYVTNGAKNGHTLSAAIEEFYRDTSWYEVTPRCGLHVHIDMTQEEDTVENTISFLSTYYILEDLFFSFAGEHRRNMGFCYPLSEDHSYLESVLSKYWMFKNNQEKYGFRESDIFVYVTGLNRYFAFNPQSLSRHGTFEFRHLEMTKDKSVLYRWIDFIFAVKKLAYSASVSDILNDAIDNPMKYAKLGEPFGINFTPYLNDSVLKRATTLLRFFNDEKVWKSSVNTNPLFKAPKKEEKKAPVKRKVKEDMAVERPALVPAVRLNADERARWINMQRAFVIDDGEAQRVPDPEREEVIRIRIGPERGVI